MSPKCVVQDGPWAMPGSRAPSEGTMPAPAYWAGFCPPVAPQGVRPWQHSGWLLAVCARRRRASVRQECRSDGRCACRWPRASVLGAPARHPLCLMAGAFRKVLSSVLRVGGGEGRRSCALFLAHLGAQLPGVLSSRRPQRAAASCRCLQQGAQPRRRAAASAAFLEGAGAGAAFLEGAGAGAVPCGALSGWTV